MDTSHRIAEADARIACESYSLDQLRHVAHVLTGRAPEFMIRKTLLWRRIVSAAPVGQTAEAAIADALGQPLPCATTVEAPKPAVPAGDVLQQRSEAALKAWATRRANGWTPKASKSAPAPLQRADLSQLAAASA